MDKQCAYCKKIFPIGDFPFWGKSLVKRGRRCVRCKSRPAATWNNRNPERARAAARRFKESGKDKWSLLKCRYGISSGEYNIMLERQGGCCAICKISVPAGRWPSFAVDHDHKTGMVRGILCAPCNHGLGMFKDSIGSLLAAIDYLRAPNKKTMAGDIEQSPAPNMVSSG